MAVLRLNGNNLHLDIIIGTEESFSPREDIKELQKEVSKAKDELVCFLKDTFGTEVVNEIQEKVSEDSELDEKLKTYIKDVYGKNIEKFKKRVEEINKEICSNYSEVVSE